jgi:DNA-binding response OmpR family regulator
MTTTSLPPTRVLVAAGDPEVARRACLVLGHGGYATTLARSAAEARRACATFTPEVVLIDGKLPDSEGLELCRWIKGAPEGAEALVILALATLPPQAASQVDLDTCADGVLMLPCSDRELLSRVAAFARLAHTTRALRVEVARRLQAESALELRAGSPAEPPAPANERQSLPRGTETVLAVEDEPAILALVRTLLERLGYKVLAAGSAVEALAIAKTDGRRIDLLVTDVVMPEMNGPTLAAELTASYPTLKTVFMSGYASSVLTTYGIDANSPNFIEKPFAISAFATRLRAALDAPTSS